MSRRTARWLGLVLGSALATRSPPARCEPEWNAALVAGASGVGAGEAWPATRFFGGLRTDLLFGRSGPRDVGMGPELELATIGFSDFRVRAGPAVLLPVGDLLAFELGPGAFVTASDRGARGGVSARVFFGFRTFNVTGSYALGGGIVTGLDQELGATREHAIVIAAQIDGLVLALPAILLFEWLRGPRSRD